MGQEFWAVKPKPNGIHVKTTTQNTLHRSWKGAVNMIKIVQLESNICCMVILFLFVVAPAPGLAQRFDRTIADADLIIVGRTAAGTPRTTGGLDLVLDVRSVLKGVTADKELRVRFDRTNTDNRVGPIQYRQACGVFFMKWSTGALELLAPVIPAFGLGDLHVPVECSTLEDVRVEDTPLTEEAILSYCLTAIEKGAPSSRHVTMLFRGVDPRHSRVAAQASERFVQSGRSEVRILGLAWRIALGDQTAVSLIARDMSTLRNHPLAGVLTSTLAGFRGSSEEAVDALGQIAAASPGSLFEVSTSEALRAIHSVRSLRYLERLLDSTIKTVRENAVAGLTLHLVGAPVLHEDAGATLDRILNPAVRRSLTPDEEQAVQLGPFANSEREESIVAWWKSWCVRNRHLLAATP